MLMNYRLQKLPQLVLSASLLSAQLAVSSACRQLSLPFSSPAKLSASHPFRQRRPSTATNHQQCRSCLQAEVRKIIMSSPIKSCSLDPVPTFILREFIDVLLPFVTQTVNASLLQGRLPDSQKHAIITLLKKPELDTTEMIDYRPVSNLSFMLKLIERVVANQLNEYLLANDLLSAYRKGHSTDTALLRVW